MGRWTEAKKQAIRDSRVRSTRGIAEALARLPEADRPKVFVCASAIGWYGDTGEEWVDETTPSGEGFLADVSREWEQACEPARDAGIRTVHLRIGVVLTPRGAALQKMLLPFKLGGGGPLGDGRFYWSWVHIEDVLGAIRHALFRDNVAGPTNVVAPSPVRQRDFARTLGRVLRRPAVIPAPMAAVRMLLGRELADAIVLSGIRVRPQVLENTGYRFRFPKLEPALRALLGRVDPS